MALTVVVRSGDAKTPPTITFDTPRVVIGRGDGCEVHLPDASVSHRHASIRQRGTDYIVIDEGSTNGTYVGPVRLPPHAPRVLRSGDWVRVGRVWLELRIEQAVPTRNPHAATKELALKLVAEALQADGADARARVEVVAGPGAGRALALAEFERAYVIGRDARADLDLLDEDCANRHVELTRGPQLMVRDLGSKQGSRLGERSLPANKAVPWPAGAELHVGQSQLVYYDPVTAALREIERVADEPMSGDEVIEPPIPVEAPTAAAAPDPPGSSDEPAASPTPPPVKPVQPARGRSRTAFNGADWLIALLALAVLGLSVMGLVWLFRLD